MPGRLSRKRRAIEADDNDFDDAAAVAASSSASSTPKPTTQLRRTNTTQHTASDDEADGKDDATQDNSNQDAMVKKLVRMALACEYQRRPIRRTEVGEKVLGNGNGRGGMWRDVFQQAQVELRSVFAMEMVELPARERVTVQQRRAAKSQQSQNKTATNWVLVSILPSKFHHPDILPPPAVPTSEEEARYISLYTLLISLILLSGGQLQDAKMERYLRRLQLEDNTPLTGTPYAKTEALLKRMERESYILKIREPTGTGEDDVYWVVGPRGKVEVGEGGARALTRAVYGELDEAGDEELERRMARSFGTGEQEQLVQKRAQRQNGQAEKRGRRRRDGGEEEQESEDEDE